MCISLFNRPAWQLVQSFASGAFSHAASWLLVALQRQRKPATGWTSDPAAMQKKMHLQGTRIRSGSDRTAHGALVAVVTSSQEALPAKGVPTGSGDWLIQQLQAQDALKVIHPFCHSRPAVNGAPERSC